VHGAADAKGKPVSVCRSENVPIDGRRLGSWMFGTFTGLGREAISDRLTNQAIAKARLIPSRSTETSETRRSRFGVRKTTPHSHRAAPVSARTSVVKRFAARELIVDG